MRTTYPLGATVLGAVGALLIVLEGVFLTVAGSSLMPISWTVFALSTTVSTSVVAAVTIGLGGLALALTLLVYLWPETHTFGGIGMISIASLSLFSGGGLLLGALMLWVGGVLAIYFGRQTGIPEDVARPQDRFEDDMLPGPTGVSPRAGVSGVGPQNR